jgi:hypothetical protein
MKNILMAMMMLPAYAFCQSASTEQFKPLQATVIEKQAIDLKNDRKGLPVYLFNGCGSGSIIGFMNNGSFRKVRPEEYQELMVQKYAQELLENEDNFKVWLRIQYGGYCVAVR